MKRVESTAEIEQWLAIAREADFRAYEIDEIERSRIRCRDLPMPTPRQRAQDLNLNALAALRTAYRQNGCWRVSRSDAPILRPYGLCEANGPFLTAFGCKVHTAAMELLQ